MSLGSTLQHVLGFVAGILIPGASANAATADHEVQQLFAKLYGPAAQKLADELKLDTTGMSGPDKVFYILKALVETAKSQGFKGDLAVLGRTLLAVAQAAYLASIKTAESDATALLASLHLGPTLTSVATLVLPVVEQKVEGAIGNVLGVEQSDAQAA